MTDPQNVSYISDRDLYDLLLLLADQMLDEPLPRCGAVLRRARALGLVTPAPDAQITAAGRRYISEI